MSISVTKYSRKCLSFYCMIMSQDNAYKNCLLIKPEVGDQGRTNNSVSVNIRCCRNPYNLSSCTWPN